MQTDWARVAWLVQASRALDAIEEGRLLPEITVLRYIRYFRQPRTVTGC